MDWENELLTTAQKAPPRKGRRAGLSLLNSREDDRPLPEDRLGSSTNESRVGTSSHAPNQPMPPPRVRRAGGWATEDSKSSKKRLSSSTVSSLLDKQRFQSLDRTKTSFDSDDDIPIIPELDDYVEDDSKPDLSYKVLAALNRVATYKELDVARPPYLKLDGIDLSVLAKCLDIEDHKNNDEDTVLSWDALFTDVTSQLRNDAECNNRIGRPSRPTDG